MEYFDFVNKWRAFFPVFLFFMGVMLFTIPLNWVGLALSNPDQMVEDLGEEYLSETILITGVTMGIGIYLFVIHGYKFYKQNRSNRS